MKIKVRGKFTTLNLEDGKGQKSMVYGLQKTNNKRQRKFKIRRKLKNLKSEIREIERQTVEKINKAQRCFFKKIMKLVNP